MANTEVLKTYDLEGKYLADQDRNDFYEEIGEEFTRTGVITRQVKSIRLLLMNSDGRVYIQKRSKLKAENSGLYDKTVGGHVKANDSFELTVTKECSEELGFPAVVVNDDLAESCKSTNLEVVGLFRQVELINGYESVRISKNSTHTRQPFISSFYIGYYDGPIKFSDGEASGIEVYSLDELEEEINNNVTKFTGDLKFMIQRFRKYIQPLPCS